jgi:iron complex outermembrane receptor protein
MRSLLLLLVAAPAMAQTPAADATGDTHLDPNPDIIVTAPFPRETFFALSGVSILTAETLARETRSTIGETLARQPGVSSTYFGPNAARPVLRGLQGERVRVLTDGIGSFDVSNTSVDHAVAISPFAADRVEVIRGPEVLLYGSSAIGGVVNSFDRRIPRGVPENDIHLDALAGYGTAADEVTLAASLDVAIKPNFVVHVDGSFLDANDLNVGGFVYSRAIREEAAEEGVDPAEYELSGRLPNSAARTWDFAGGATLFFGEDSSAGVSVTRMESRYGVPNRLEIGHDDHDHDEDHDHDHDHDDDHDHEGHSHEDITLDMRQTRVDFRVDLGVGDGFLERVRLRGGWADYVHDEIEAGGEIGTTFLSDGGELRLELVQREADGWKGASGFQFLNRTLDAFGEEAYIPSNSTNQYGFFTLQEFDLGAVKAEASVRYERSEVRSDVVDFDRGFNAFSGSVGASVALGRGFRAGLSYTHAERAPAAEELLSFGPHFATQAFEVGDPNLNKERSDGIEATLRGRGDGWSANFAVYHTRFSNFIYLEPTGEEEDELPVFAYVQDRANFTGLELDADARIGRFGETEVRGTFLLDWVKATLDDGSPAPLIPPLRLLGGIEADWRNFGGRLEVEHTTAQDRVAATELPTDGWTMLNIAITWRPWGPESRSLLMLQANNLNDADARRHASFVKDFAPLPGRDIRLSARFSF